MKTKQFTLPNGEYIAIEAGADTSRHTLRFEDKYKMWSLDYQFVNESGGGSTSLMVKDFGGRANYPKADKLKIVGFTGNMSERDWSNILPCANIKKPDKNMFIDYMSENNFNDYSKQSAKEAGDSLKAYLGVKECVIIEVLPNV